MILSATLFMLVVLSILYGLAMRHEVHIHLYKTMLTGVHNYAETPELPVNSYWDNVQMQVSVHVTSALKRIADEVISS